jgi:hypothetical protein
MDMRSMFKNGNSNLAIFLVFFIVASMLLAGTGVSDAGSCDDDCHEQCENCDDCVRCVSSIDMIDGTASLTILSDLYSSRIDLSLSANYDNAFLNGPDPPPRYIH